MAYFPNGTSGMLYEEQYCANCVHFRDGCAVMDVHNFYNYDQFGEDDRSKAIKTILDLLIPETADGTDKCNMFAARANPEAEDAEMRRLAQQPAKYEAIMRERAQ
jgi:hypothetical protein